MGGEGGGGGEGVRSWEGQVGWGGQGRCEWRSEVFVTIQNKKKKFGGGGDGGGGVGLRGVRLDVKEELKFL